MSGSATKKLKKIEKFVDILILNTPPEELNKSRDMLIEEVKLQLRKTGKDGLIFIDKVISGEFFNEKN